MIDSFTAARRGARDAPPSLEVCARADAGRLVLRAR
jgi:hypothetical protein